MKNFNVSIRKITLYNANGYHGVRWYHPSAELPIQFTNHSYETLTVQMDEIVEGVVVSNPFVYEDNVCVVVQISNNNRYESYESYETFWVGHLG